MFNRVYGLDFGTTNSVISILEQGQARVLPISRDGGNSIPSLLFFPVAGREYWVGDEALAHYLASGMQGRLMQSIKMFLPDSTFRGTQVPGIGYCNLERLVSMMLKEIKARADALVGEDIRAVVLGRPGRFSDVEEEEQTAERRLIAAARLAGFEEIRFQREPVAAAFYYETSLTRPELALIADLGGGTSDFTLVHLSPEHIHGDDRAYRPNRADDILGTRSVAYAGDEIDSDLMWHKGVGYFGARTRYEASPGQWLEMPAHLLHAICRWREIPFLRERRTRAFIEQVLFTAADKEAIGRLKMLVDGNVGFSLFQSIERAKRELSTKSATTLEFSQSGIDIHEPVARQEFGRMILKGLTRLGHCIDGLLDESGVEAAQVDAVFLTGGTSRVYWVKKLLAKKFGKEKLKPGDAFISVAAGLALSSRMLFKD